MKLIVQKITGQKSFGYHRYVPVCDVSKELLKLRRPKTTFENEDLRILKALGFEIEVENEK